MLLYVKKIPFLFQVGGTNFTVCVVIGAGDTVASLQPQTNFPHKFNYYLLNLKTVFPICSFLNRVVTKGEVSNLAKEINIFNAPNQKNILVSSKAI